MRKLLKQLKPYIGSIILIFLLLLGQAMCDLTLPDMMSRIINVGIQQNGISGAAPLAIRASEMDRLLLFTDATDKSVIRANYTLLDRKALSDDEFKSYQETYPVLAENPVYVLQTRDQKVQERLDEILRQPALIVGHIKSGAAANLFGQSLPADVDIFALLTQMPQDQLESVLQTADEQIDAIPDNIVTQSNASYLNTEYNAIGINVGRIQIMFILRIGGLMLLLTLLSVACSVSVGFLAARVAAGFGRNTRRHIFSRVNSFSNREMDEFSTASLITRSTNDIQQIQLVLVMLLRIVFFAPIMGIGGIIKALGQDVSMSWIIAAAVMVLISLLVVIFSIAIPKFRLIQKLVDKVNLVTREMLTGLMVVRAFNTQGFEEKRFDGANRELTKNTLFINRVMVFMMPAMMLLMNGTMVLIIWIGAQQIEQGSIAVGNMMAFMQYTMQIIFAFLMVSFVFIMLPRAIVSAQRISEVIETEPTIIDPAQPVTFPSGSKGLVEFQDVCFKYTDADDCVLEGIKFTAEPGQTTAIIGGTGSGKSTLINLVPRFYDVTEGRVLVDHVDVRAVTQHDLRQKIGYIPQKTVLFSGTVESNIAYGLDEPVESVVARAAEIAQSTDFINASTGGFQASVSQGGANLSGGQKQRLSIARALAKKPEIFIFDDSFSAIDFKTDASLRRALKRDTGGTTMLIVAQRINTIMHADKIIVLEKGRLVGEGSHRQLMDGCQVYRELALSQLSEEELQA